MYLHGGHFSLGQGCGGGHLRSSGVGNLTAGHILGGSVGHGLGAGHLGQGGISCSFGPHFTISLQTS
tara:strand:+ start:319 stop:519 length:201 start_codon:yes stop_codon:yes gene_type:complete